MSPTPDSSGEHPMKLSPTDRRQWMRDIVAPIVVAMVTSIVMSSVTAYTQVMVHFASLDHRVSEIEENIKTQRERHEASVERERSNQRLLIRIDERMTSVDMRIRRLEDRWEQDRRDR